MTIGQQNIIIQISVNELSELIKQKTLEAIDEYERRTQARRGVKEEMDLVTVKMAAQITGKSENTIRSYINSGALNSYEGMGRYKIMVSKKELEQCKSNGLL